MIKNERQYRITKSQIAAFQQALGALSRRGSKHVHPLLRSAQREALASQLNDLLVEAREYETLRAGRRRLFKLESIDDLPRALIRARIARGLTQKQLAERIGMKEQQVQRYEACEYTTASWGRIKRVIRALGVQVKERVLLE